MAWVEGYKAFNSNMACIGKQYKVGETYTEEAAIPCKRGMHFCKSPVALLRYYPLLNWNGDLTRFARVEGENPIESKDKLCTTHLKIKEELSFSEWVDECFLYLSQEGTFAAGDYIPIRTSTTKFSTMAWDLVFLDGFRRDIAIPQYRYGCTVVSKAINSNISAFAENVRIASAGSYSNVNTSGYRAIIHSAGYRSYIAALGDNSVVSASGSGSVAFAKGVNSKVKACKGSWIVLGEQDGKRGLKIETRYVDGERIKANTFYSIKHGEFVEAREE